VDGNTAGACGIMLWNTSDDGTEEVADSVIAMAMTLSCGPQPVHQ